MTAAPPPDPTHPRKPSESRDPIDALDSAAKATRLFTALERGIDDPERDVPAPPSIPGYELLSRLGSGGQGDSWLARRTPMSTGMGTLGVGDPLLAAQSTMPASAGAPIDATVHDAAGRRSVVKILRYSSYGFPQFYWRELEALLNLKLDCLPRIEASGIVDGMPWIAMEYIEGADGAHLESLLGWSAKIEFLAQTAEALASLHDAGFVHRDIKPSNILRRGSDGSPAILDLGLATRTAEAGASSTIGIALGTPEFMSPEQACGERATPKSDQWSIAATALVILTGFAPHPIESTIEAQLAKARDAKPRSAREIDPSIDEKLARVFDRALDRSPERRFSDCRAFAAALRNPAEVSLASLRFPIGTRIAIVAALAITLVAIVAVGIANFAEQMSANNGLTERARMQATISANYPQSQFGVTVLLIGDLDDCGVDEIAVAAPTAPARLNKPWRDNAGKIYIYRGEDVRYAVATKAAMPKPHVLEGPWRGGQIGVRLARLGDVNGDGMVDFGAVVAANDVSAAPSTGLLAIAGSRSFIEPGVTDLATHDTVFLPQDAADGPFANAIGQDLDDDGCADIIMGESARGPNRIGGLVVAFGARSWSEVGTRRESIHAPNDVRGFGTTIVSIDERLIAVGAPLGTELSKKRGAVLFGALYLDRATHQVVFRETGRVIGGRDDEWFGMSIDSYLDRDHHARIAVGASGIARAAGDGGSALLMRFPLPIACGTLIAPLPDETLRADDSREGNTREAHTMGEFIPGEPKWIVDHMHGSASTVGAGSLLGTSVAVFRDGWAIGAPRDRAGGIAAGAVFVRGGVARLFHGNAHGIHFGNALLASEFPMNDANAATRSPALWIGAPFSEHNGTHAAGCVELVLIEP